MSLSPRPRVVDATPQPPLLVGLADACATLGIAYQTGRNWISEGRFPVETFKVGSRRLARLADLQAFVDGLHAEEQNTALPPDPPAELAPPEVTAPRPRGRRRLGSER